MARCDGYQASPRSWSIYNLPPNQQTAHGAYSVISTQFGAPVCPASSSHTTANLLHQLDDKLPTLEEAGMRRLGSPTSSPPAVPTPTSKHLDRAFQLKRLAKSLLLNFLELLGILAVDPRQATQKIDDLRTLFINFHHVLNEYRPHQARESLIALMQDRLDKTRAETQAVRAAVDRARREIEGLASITLPEREGERRVEGEEADQRQREADAWAEVDALFG
jgi:mediator of RNA polymerase II transcription subunit 7